MTRTERAILIIISLALYVLIVVTMEDTQDHFDQALVKYQEDNAKLIKELNRQKIIHTYIPEDAKCAVKLWHFKGKDGKLYPADRMTCHWSQR